MIVSAQSWISSDILKRYTIEELEALIAKELARLVEELLAQEAAEIEHRLIHGTGVGIPLGILR